VISRFEAKTPDDLCRYRVVRSDSCANLPGSVVMADVITGEVIMQENGWERTLDADGKPRKDQSGADMWVQITRKYQFPPGSIKIMRK
jgi:hypothetical protein